MTQEYIPQYPKRGLNEQQSADAIGISAPQLVELNPNLLSSNVQIQVHYIQLLAQC